jgi:hypothetical protein
MAGHSWWGGSPVSRPDAVDAFKTTVRQVQLKSELNQQK